MTAEGPTLRSSHCAIEVDDVVLWRVVAAKGSRRIRGRSVRSPCVCLSRGVHCLDAVSSLNGPRQGLCLRTMAKKPMDSLRPVRLVDSLSTCTGRNVSSTWSIQFSERNRASRLWSQSRVIPAGKLSCSIKQCFPTAGSPTSCRFREPSFDPSSG